MQILRNYVEQIRKLLGGMSVAAKMAVGLLMVVIVAMVALLIAYGGRPDMVAVFKAPLSGEDLGAAEHILRREDIEVEVNNGQLMVPAEKREAAYAALAFEAILPADSVSEFEQLAREPSMWRTESQDRRLWHQAKQSKLSQLIGMFPPVTKAQAIVEAGQPKKLGTPAVSATASVHVTLKRGESMSTKLRAAIADLVAGSVPGMDRSNVRIVDATNQRSYRVKEQEDLGADTLENVAEMESYYRKKVEDLLYYIPNVIVSVYAVPDPVKSERSVDKDYEPPVSEVLESSISSATGVVASGGEPGVSTNTGVRLPSAAAGGGGGSTETSDESMTVRFPERWVETLKGGGVTERISASVAVPLEYLVSVCKQRDGLDEGPSEAQLNIQIDHIQGQVINALGLAAAQADLVKVAWYIPGVAAEPEAAAEAGVLTTVAHYGKPAALGALALGALLMVVMFARRRHAPVPQQEQVPSIFAGGLTERVGLVKGGDVALEGVELNDDQVRAQRVVEQVGQMVKEKPDSAASLVKRWMDES